MKFIIILNMLCRLEIMKMISFIDLSVVGRKERSFYIFLNGKGIALSKRYCPMAVDGVFVVFKELPPILFPLSRYLCHKATGRFWGIGNVAFTSPLFPQFYIAFHDKHVNCKTTKIGASYVFLGFKPNPRAYHDAVSLEL